MPTDTDGTYRTLHDSTPAATELREAEDVGEDDIMELRMPIASSGEVRNEGDDPLTTEELRGMAEQVDSGQLGVFPEHGHGSAIDGPQYSQFEKLGYWHSADFQRGAADDGSDILVATARMPDPEELPAATGEYREALAILKEQARHDVPISASIGWRDDDAFPGGVDLMEVSIVGIGADPRTSTAASAEAEALARSAVTAGADPDEFLAAVAETVRSASADAPEDCRPFGPPNNPDQWDDFDECVSEVENWDGVDDPEAFCAWAKDKTEQSAGDGDAERATYEVGDETITIDPPEPMVNAAREALDAKARYDDLSDCGTGVGEDRARQIIEDEVGPEVVDEIAAYLTSHEEDVASYDEPPTDWGREQWLGIPAGDDDDPRCGPVQYALWGGLSTGTALDWAQRKANEVAAAKGEEEPYERDTPDEQMTDSDDPGDEQAGTDDEQDASDGEASERAPDDVSAEDIADFAAAHFDGMDASDLMDAVGSAGGEYVGAVDKEALAGLVAICVDVSTDDALDAMAELAEDGDGEDADDEQATDEDGEGDEDEDEDDDDEEMNSQTTEQSGDADDLRQRVDDLQAELEETREAIRNGEFDGGFGDREQVADELTEDEDDADEQRDNDGNSHRDGWLSETNI